MPGGEAPEGVDGPAAAPPGGSGPSGRRRAVVLVAALLSVVGLAVGIPLGVLRSGSKPAAGPAAVTTSSLAGPQPSLVLKELWNRSEAMAFSGGDLAAQPREAVGPVPYDKTDAVLGGGPEKDSDPVFLIEIGGKFFCGSCGRGVHGHAETSLLLARTLQDEAGGIGPWVGLRSLGRPFELPPPPDGADLWTLPDFSSLLGSWAGGGATVELRNGGGASTLRWATHHVDFDLVAVRSGVSSGIATSNGTTERIGPVGVEAFAVVTADDVGLASGSALSLFSTYTKGTLQLSVTAGEPHVSIPSPLTCVQLASGMSCHSKAG